MEESVNINPYFTGVMRYMATAWLSTLVVILPFMTPNFW